MKIKLVTLLIVFSVVLYSCKKKSNLDGVWVINQSGILLTSLEDDKSELSHSCTGKLVEFKNNKILFDSSCIFFSDIKSISYPVFINKKFDSLEINNPERLIANIYGSYQKGDEFKLSTYLIEKTDSEKKISNMYLFSDDKNRIILVDDPYFLILQRQ